MYYINKMYYIRQLLKYYVAGARVKTNGGALAIHLAAQNKANAQVVELLLHAFPLVIQAKPSQTILLLLLLLLLLYKPSQAKPMHLRSL